MTNGVDASKPTHTTPIQVSYLPGGSPTWQDVEAWDTGVPGLTITRSPAGPGWFSITHNRSGMAMGPYVFDSVEKAREIAQRAGELCDWESHEGSYGSVSGDLLDALLPLVREGRHVWDLFWDDTDDEAGGATIDELLGDIDEALDEHRKDPR